MVIFHVSLPEGRLLRDPPSSNRNIVCFLPYVRHIYIYIYIYMLESFIINMFEILFAIFDRYLEGLGK